MWPSLCPVLGVLVAVVPAAWHEVQADACPVSAWLPVAGPVAVIALTPMWQAAQPLPVVPQAGVVTKDAATGLAWQDAAEQVVPAVPFALSSW
jgi:hypothetical protein